MSRIIKMTQQNLDDIRAEFEIALSGAKLSDGKISFTKTFGTIDRKATLYFEEIAYQKMLALVREFDKEVAWHGLARRGGDPNKDEYIIYDILVYPQEVTGATVNTDQEKYQMWLMSHEDDVFNAIRMQGHSHVHMNTSPSTVDTSLYEQILDQLDDTMFYIFLIWNKRGDRTIKIYDMQKNVLFETTDITVSILDNGNGISGIIKQAKELVHEKYTSSNGTSLYAVNGGSQYGGNGYGGYGGYGGNAYGGHNYGTQSSTPEKKDHKPAIAKGDPKPTTATASASEKKRKKKRKSGKSKVTQYIQQSLWPSDEYDDD